MRNSTLPEYHQQLSSASKITAVYVTANGCCTGCFFEGCVVNWKVGSRLVFFLISRQFANFEYTAIFVMSSIILVLFFFAVFFFGVSLIVVFQFPSKIYISENGSWLRCLKNVFRKERADMITEDRLNRKVSLESEHSEQKSKTWVFFANFRTFL